MCFNANKIHKIHKCVKYQCNTTFVFIQMCKYKYKNTTTYNIRQIIIEYEPFCVGFNETSWLHCRHNSRIESHFFISNLLIMIFFFNKNNDLCVRICVHVHTCIHISHGFISRNFFNINCNFAVDVRYIERQITPLSDVQRQILYDSTYIQTYIHILRIEFN